MDPPQESSVALQQVPPPITLNADNPPAEPTLILDAVPDPSVDETRPEAQPLPDTQEASGDQPPAATTTPPRPAPPEVETAYWADIEEDTSLPDEAEMKEIESAADGDYSAYECEYRTTIRRFARITQVLTR